MSNSRKMARPPADQSANAEPAIEGATRTTKAATIIALLQRPDGAALHELIAATGWLPHTTRAALTGLKKKGHQLTKAKVDGVTRYTIAGEAGQ